MQGQDLFVFNTGITYLAANAGTVRFAREWLVTQRAKQLEAFASGFESIPPLERPHDQVCLLLTCSATCGRYQGSAGIGVVQLTDVIDQDGCGLHCLMVWHAGGWQHVCSMLGWRTLGLTAVWVRLWMLPRSSSFGLAAWCVGILMHLRNVSGRLHVWSICLGTCPHGCVLDLRPLLMLPPTLW